MFVLNRNDFGAVDTNRVSQFVECWERYYRGKDQEYLAELNLGNDLTEQNLTRLLRWKDRRMLTHPKKDGAPNHRVIRVLERIDSMNCFRNGYLTTDDFGKITQEIFPTGIIWQLFLFHIARPADWPIADQHIFRSYIKLFNAARPDNINDFHCGYAKKFRELATTLRRNNKIDDDNLGLVVRSNKRLDNALLAFGQFLATYDC